MKRVLFSSTLLLLAALMGYPQSATGQDQSASGQTAGNGAEQPATDAETNGEEAESENDAQRLPPGYSDIITSSQRRNIYRIQQSVQVEIDALQAQIAALVAKRDAEIEAVLDKEQKEILKFILMIRERNRKEMLEEQQKAEAAQGGAEAPAAAAPAATASE
ncbi:MAG: hypothetical protein R3C05_16965 [Pirellulaceae bacterium]